jgi:hypothetical protein
MYRQLVITAMVALLTVGCTKAPEGPKPSDEALPAASAQVPAAPQQAPVQQQVPAPQKALVVPGDDVALQPVKLPHGTTELRLGFWLNGEWEQLVLASAPEEVYAQWNPFFERILATYEPKVIGAK